ncbi:MAG: CsbD family protein [Roseovarius sp.]
MNWEQIQGKWNQLKGDARVEWAKLTEQDVDKVEGERDKLVGLIQEKHGRSKEEARAEIDDWCRRVA